MAAKVEDDNQSQSQPQKQSDALALENAKLQVENAKNLGTLIDKGLPIVDKYFSQKIEKVEAPKIRMMFWIFGGILFLSVIITGVLTYTGKVSSDNFTFLLGTLLGTIITLIGDVTIGAEG